MIWDIEQGKVTFVFVSPELTLASERWQSILASEVYQENLIGVVVDKVHCVTEWVISNKQREEISLPALVHPIKRTKITHEWCTISCTRCNSNQENQGQNIWTAGIQVTEESVRSLNKLKVGYWVQKLEVWLKGKDTARTSIYCQTVKQCSLMFKMFEVELGASLFHREINDPCMRLVDVMHSGSPKCQKLSVSKIMCWSSFQIPTIASEFWLQQKSMEWELTPKM